MDKPTTVSRKLVFGMCVSLLILVVLLGYVSGVYKNNILSIYNSELNSSLSYNKETIRGFWIRLSSDESIEYSWKEKVTPHPYRDQIEFDGYLIWSINGETRRFLVSVDPYIPQNIALRINKDGNLWLLQKPSGHTNEAPFDPFANGVIASLNRKTGELINNFGQVVDYKLSDQEQENLPRPSLDNTGTAQVKSFPTWANAKSGETIVRTGDVIIHTVIH